MENASKALLIAAAVLIVLVLISVAVYLISNTSSTTDSAGQVSNQLESTTAQGAEKINQTMTGTNFFNYGN